MFSFKKYSTDLYKIWYIAERTDGIIVVSSPDQKLEFWSDKCIFKLDLQEMFDLPATFALCCRNNDVIAAYDEKSVIIIDELFNIKKEQIISENRTLLTKALLSWHKKLYKQKYNNMFIDWDCIDDQDYLIITDKFNNTILKKEIDGELGLLVCKDKFIYHDYGPDFYVAKETMTKRAK